MLDLIEDDDIPMWRLLAITLHAVAMLAVVALTPKVDDQADLSQVH